VSARRPIRRQRTPSPGDVLLAAVEAKLRAGREAMLDLRAGREVMLDLHAPPTANRPDSPAGDRDDERSVIVGR
jgi:hypothetical protein